MDLNTLKTIDPWQWPEDADVTILKVLRDSKANPDDRLLAAEFAGEITVISDELAEALLSILNSKESDPLRCTAATALGPVLEYTDTMEDEADMPELEDVEILISEETFTKIRETLRRHYMDADNSKELRRRALESSSRAPQSWHHEAVRAAYADSDEEWRLSAVFCMRYTPGFDNRILDALKNKNPDIHYEAVCAAGEWGLEEAWPHISKILTSKKTDKNLLLAAMDAVVGIRPEEAPEILADFLNSTDPDIAAAAQEAIEMAEELSNEDDDEFDDYADDYEDEDDDEDDKW